METQGPNDFVVGSSDQDSGKTGSAKTKRIAAAATDDAGESSPPCGLFPARFAPKTGAAVRGTEGSPTAFSGDGLPKIQEMLAVVEGAARREIA
jgi:hypothetical protein